MQAGIDLTLDLKDDLPMPEGDTRRLQQVILNLIINAIQAIDHDHGKIKIITGFQKKKGQLFVSVSDNGRGIDPNISNRIFNPFVTSKKGGRRHRSWSFCYLQSGKAHDGEITFMSPKGKGTTFNISFLK